MEVKAVKQNKIPTAVRGHEFKGSASAIRASITSCAIQVAYRVEDQTGGRALPVRLGLKTVDDLLCARRRHLEDCAVIVRTSKAGSAIKIAGLVENQSTLRDVRIGSFAKPVNNALVPASPR